MKGVDVPNRVTLSENERYPSWLPWQYEEEETGSFARLVMVDQAQGLVLPKEKFYYCVSLKTFESDCYCAFISAKICLQLLSVFNDFYGLISLSLLFNANL